MITTRHTKKSLVLESDGVNHLGMLEQGQPVAKAIIPKDKIKTSQWVDLFGNPLWEFDGDVLESVDVFRKVWAGDRPVGCRFVLDRIIQ